MTPAQAVEAALSVASAPHAGAAVFVLKFDAHVTPQIVTTAGSAWRQAWRQAGRINAPPLVIIGANETLTALGDAELRQLGLMRIPSPEA